MKFSVNCTLSGARLGVITNVVRLPHFKMETPNILLYTKGGTIPHLTPDVVQKVTKENLGLHIPVSHLIQLHERIKLSKMDLAEFIGMNEFLTCCSFIDPGIKRVEGFHYKSNIPFFTRYGRSNLSATSYMNILETLKPDLFLILADGDTHSESSQKRCIKSVSNTLNLYNECMSEYEKSEILNHSGLMVAVEGGYNLELREKCSEIIGKSPAFAVVIDGFHDYSEKAVEIEFKDIKPVLEASLKHIPSDKLRVINGSWNPSVMLELINFGIDMFDSSYPFLATEQGRALIFPNDDRILDGIFKNQRNENENNLSEFLNSEMPQTYSSELEEVSRKKIKLNSQSMYSISLTDSRHANNFSPIIQDCPCYTCKHHTRAYIHHLLNVKELLGPTLIMIHNLHHYLQFFSLIRKSLSCGAFEKLRKNFQAWTDNMNCTFKE